MNFLFINVTSNFWTRKIKDLQNYVNKLKKKRGNKKSNIHLNLKSYQIILISNQNTMIFVHLDNSMKKLTKDVKLENKIYKIVSKMIVIQKVKVLKRIKWIKMNSNQLYNNNWDSSQQQSWAVNNAIHESRIQLKFTKKMKKTNQ